MAKGKDSTQEARVIEYMSENGSIERLQAFSIGVANLTAVISRIRQSGIEVFDKIQPHNGTYGKSHFKIYSLVRFEE